jgi:hypothetical protein
MDPIEESSSSDEEEEAVASSPLKPLLAAKPNEEIGNKDSGPPIEV